MNLKNKVILVTGGTSGIGEACSRHFAALGAKVVIASNQQDRGHALEKELREAGREVRFIYADVSQEESVKAMVDHRRGPTDVLTASTATPGSGARVK